MYAVTALCLAPSTESEATKREKFGHRSVELHLGAKFAVLAPIFFVDNILYPIYP